MINKVINIDLLEYYYLISIKNKFELLTYAYNLKKEILKLQVKSLSYGYIVEKMYNFQVTKKGELRIIKLRKQLNLKGSERYVVPNFKYMNSRQIEIDEIYFD